ncbi:protein NRT1/ PTR FAMILY 1.2-like [Cucumis melo]|uniref:Protein NRT1/ PTR FAMILY 1.2-like n=1 Tax=Cucumis melo TaxID=3656 RepID=A0A1S4DVD3_CUCME|nr:protein NRT1/ PTR FAMILY 1.2-like [Cucumis melo]
MEDQLVVDENRGMEEPLLSDTDDGKGGLRTLPFIIANGTFEKVASHGLSPSMILYLTEVYGMKSAHASNVIFLWSAATNFTPIICAFLADSYFGRFSMIAAGSIFSFLGMFVLWLTAIIPQVRPFCDKINGYCDAPSTPQLLLLYSSYAIMSIGSGCLQASHLAFGADQLYKESKSNSGILNSYFNICYISIAVGTLIGMSCIVYIQDRMGWGIGFGVSVALMLLATITFLSASSLYLKSMPSKSWCDGLVQVVFATYKKRHMQIPFVGTFEMYHHETGSLCALPSNKLRFLNKACIIRNFEEELTSDGKASNPWSLCTVEQVENLKALIRIIPLWSTGILFSVSLSQSFYVLQVASMDRHLTSSFEVPAGSFSVLIVVFVIIWIILYNCLILPLASKCRGKPTHLSGKTRMGLGILCCTLSLAVSAIVEGDRRALAIKEGFSNDPNAVVSMSAFWTLPRYILFGMAEAFNAIGQIEFFYNELPKAMSSVATSLLGLNSSVGNLAASFIMTTVDNFSKAVGGKSWVSSNINDGHSDYYYWLLFGLLFANFLYFLACSKSYGPSKEESAGRSTAEDYNNTVN